MDEKESNKLVRGALLLTLAGLVSKVLSAGYRIPLQNLTGDIGFYIYQQVYPLLGMALVFSLYGFPSAVARITVELKHQRKSLSVTHFAIPVFVLLFIMNGAIFIILYTNAQTLASLVGDVQLTKVYQQAAFVFLLIPFTALLRGIFQGSFTMQPIAYSQVGEQLIRVTIIIIVALLFARGKLPHIHTIGEGAVFASIAAACIAILVLLVFLYQKKPLVKGSFIIPWKDYIRTIVVLGIVASLNHMILLIIQLADTITLIPQLQHYGLSQIEAMEAKGIFDRGQPLIQLGTVLGSSFALALVPSVTRDASQRQDRSFNDAIISAVTLSFYLAAGATLGLMMIFPETNVLLFKNLKGTGSLQILSISIILSSLAITVAAILQGLGVLVRTAWFIVLAFIVKYISNVILVPLYGITGGAIATVISLLILSMLVFYELYKKQASINFLKHIRWSTFMKACLGMGSYIILLKYIFSYITISSRISLLIYVIFMAFTGAFIYFYILIRGQAFTKKQLSMLPFSSFFLRIYK